MFCVLCFGSMLQALALCFAFCAMGMDQHERHDEAKLPFGLSRMQSFRRRPSGGHEYTQLSLERVLPPATATLCFVIWGLLGWPVIVFCVLCLLALVTPDIVFCVLSLLAGGL